MNLETLARIALQPPGLPMHALPTVRRRSNPLRQPATPRLSRANNFRQTRWTFRVDITYDEYV